MCAGRVKWGGQEEKGNNKKGTTKNVKKNEKKQTGREEVTKNEPKIWVGIF